MRIYYRIYEGEEALSFCPRWKGHSKIDILKKCWVSMNWSVTSEDSIILIEDQCSEELVKWFVKECKTKNLEVRHIGPHPKNEYPHYIELIKLLDYWTELEPQEIHYIANDDYLYLPQALDILKSIYKDGWKGFVVPFDYPDRYTLDKKFTVKTTQLCEMHLGSRCHWRTIPSCPGITSALGEMWQKHMLLMHQTAVYHQDSWTWLAYAKDGCLCPIPGVSTHLTENCMTPLIDWDRVWDEANIS